MENLEEVIDGITALGIFWVHQIKTQEVNSNQRESMLVFGEELAKLLHKLERPDAERAALALQKLLEAN